MPLQESYCWVVTVIVLQYMQYTSSDTEGLYFELLAHTLLRSINQLLLGKSTVVCLIRSAPPQTQGAQRFPIWYSRSAHIMYKRNYTPFHCYLRGDSNEATASRLVQGAHIFSSYHLQSTKNYFAFTCSEQAWHLQICAVPCFATNIYHGCTSLFHKALKTWSEPTFYVLTPWSR